MTVCTKCKLDKPDSEFLAMKSRLSGITHQCKVCTRKRRRAYRAARTVREPGWRKKGRHNWRFGGNREIVFKRDNNACVKCGMDRNTHKMLFGKDITIDHIDGNGFYLPADKRNNDINNLQTLCMPCHGIKDLKYKKNYKLTYIDAINIRHCKGYLSGAGLAKYYNLSRGTIIQIWQGKRWPPETWEKKHKEIMEGANAKV